MWIILDWFISQKEQNGYSFSAICEIQIRKTRFNQKKVFMIWRDNKFQVHLAIGPIRKTESFIDFIHFFENHQLFLIKFYQNYKTRTRRNADRNNVCVFYFFDGKELAWSLTDFGYNRKFSWIKTVAENRHNQFCLSKKSIRILGKKLR